MPVEPLYQADESICQPGNPAEQGALQWFSDDACTLPVNFTATRMKDYCEDSVDKVALGSAIDVDPSAWTLTPGNRLDVGCEAS